MSIGGFQIRFHKVVPCKQEHCLATAFAALKQTRKPTKTRWHFLEFFSFLLTLGLFLFYLWQLHISTNCNVTFDTKRIFKEMKRAKKRAKKLQLCIHCWGFYFGDYWTKQKILKINHSDILLGNITWHHCIARERNSKCIEMSKGNGKSRGIIYQQKWKETRNKHRER